MSATDFLPRRQADLLNWSRAFNNPINANPEAYGLTFEQAADYNAKHNAFAAAFAIAMRPGSNSTVNIRAKNEAQKTLRTAARQLAGIIRSKRLVTDAQKASLGMTIRKRGGWNPRTPVPPVAPRIHVISEKYGRVKIRLINTAEPSRRGRPRGTGGAVLFRFIGENPPPGRDGWAFVGQTVHIVNTIAMPKNAEPGAKVWFTAMWKNTRGDLGPASTPVYVRQPFDVVGAIGHSRLRLAA